MDEKYGRNCSKFINQRIFESHQLKKTPEHFTEIAQTITLAQENNIETNVYLEDWVMECVIPEYVFEYLDFSTKQPVKRILLPDTLGV
jgi:D-citramalate synthase